MHEDELTTVNYEENDDILLPDGWQEGDDIFADPSTWSGASQQSGQTEETQTKEESTVVEESTEEVPTTDATEETEGLSAEHETAEAESGQTQPTEKRSRILNLKVNHEDLEVDIESMSDDELIAALQKGYAFDALKIEREKAKDEQAKAKYRQVYNHQVSEGMTPETARLVAANEVGGKNYPLEDPVEPEKPTTPAPTVPQTPARDFSREIKELKELYPDAVVPDEVAKAAAKGTNLLTAYLAYREKQTSKAAASLKKENEVLKQNAASAAKAPVKGITGGGATNTKPTHDLLKGFDMDW